jgi:hypothetical protein
MTLFFESGIYNLKNLTNQLLTLFLAGRFSTLKMEVTVTPKRRLSQTHMATHPILHNHRFKSLKSYNFSEEYKNNKLRI